MEVISCNFTCKCCNTLFSFERKDIEDRSYGTTVKKGLRCPVCGELNIIIDRHS